MTIFSSTRISVLAWEFRTDLPFVLFVHGVAGTPRDLKAIVESLDRTRFQPAFVYYPSGLSLQKLGTGLAHLLRVELARSNQLQGEI